MIPDRDYSMVEQMERHGGSFVRALAMLLQRADPINYSKLENTFPEYFEEYRKMAKKRL